MQDMFQQQAESIYEVLCTVYLRKHVLQKTSLSFFEHLPSEFYEKTTEDLQAMGFMSIVDYEDVTLNSLAEDNKTMIRVLIDPHNTIYVNVSSVYNIEKGIRENILDLTSFMDNGVVCSTVNSLSPSKLTNSPKVRKRFLEPSVSYADLINAHETLCFEEVYKNRCTVNKLNGSSSEVFEYVKKIQRLEAEYRESIPGKLLYDELLGSFEYDDQIARTMQKILIQMDRRENCIN